MDHLPYPEDAHYPCVSIPYLAKEAATHYDRNGFLTFPTRSGWERDGSEWFESNDAYIAAQGAQVWLYFGLLQEILGSKFQEADFISNIDGGSHVLMSSRTATSHFETRCAHMSGYQSFVVVCP